jgi:hypothetical protein
MYDYLFTLCFIGIGFGGAWLIEKFVDKFFYRERW